MVEREGGADSCQHGRRPPPAEHRLLVHALSPLMQLGDRGARPLSRARLAISERARSHGDRGEKCVHLLGSYEALVRETCQACQQGEGESVPRRQSCRGFRTASVSEPETVFLRACRRGRHRGDGDFGKRP